jgi:Cft2 family RNA processing exonuclease
MQTGPSRDLFELWAPDSRNGLIITGYSIEGTLARVSDFFFYKFLCSVVFVIACIYIKEWRHPFPPPLLCEHPVLVFCPYFAMWVEI